MSKPSYCNNMITDMDSVPPIEDMTPFVPYFFIEGGTSDFVVNIKFPAGTWQIGNGNPGPPSQGPCGSASDHQYTITYNDQGPSTAERVETYSVPHAADPSGDQIIVYTEPEEGENDVVAVKSKKGVGCD